MFDVLHLTTINLAHQNEALLYASPGREWMCCIFKPLNAIPS
jgi:hypothetical protein